MTDNFPEPCKTKTMLTQKQGSRLGSFFCKSAWSLSLLRLVTPRSSKTEDVEERVVSTTACPTIVPPWRLRTVNVLAKRLRARHTHTQKKKSQARKHCLQLFHLQSTSQCLVSFAACAVLRRHYESFLLEIVSASHQSPSTCLPSSF